jgi:hypothetical protein
MVNNNHTSARAGAAKAPEGRHPGDDEADTPPDSTRGSDAAIRQKGEPGLPDPKKGEWSPGSKQEE